MSAKSKQRFPTIAFALLAVLGCAALVRLVFMVPNPPSKPIADAINTNNQRHVGVVVKVEPRHQFENGAITEGWLMRSDDSICLRVCNRGKSKQTRHYYL